MDEISQPQVKIERPLYDQQQLREDYEYHRYKRSYLKSFCDSCKSLQPMDVLKRTIPVLEWLPKYSWKTDFPSDLVSGITVAIMHIAQGMAYALLGNVSPVVGIYMAFFPVLVYFLLGNSRHVSMGTFAIVCLMTGKVVIEHSDPIYFKDDAHQHPDAVTNPNGNSYSPIEVACAVTLITGLIQLLMYVFRLGIVSTLLSETLVSGFITGSAIHVVISQIKDILGLRIPKERGYFVNILTCKNIVMNLEHVNYATIIISVITITVSVFNNEFLKPRVAKKCSLPIPIELIAIVTGTVLSYSLDLHDVYGIKIIGHIPSGLPMPTVPRLSLISQVWMDCIMIAIVSYTISLSMGMIFAQKLNYEVDANQELLAKGMGNVVGSFFSCMPFTASLSRSSIQESVGGKTQIVSVVSSLLLLIILIWIGPYFETLPKCVLASVILVALKGMLLQIRDFFVFWSLSKLDALAWLATFLAVTFIGIDVGLIVGVVMSLAYIFLLGLKPYTCLLGWVPNTDLYLDLNRYKGVKELTGIKIFHYQGSINFASKNFFRKQLFDTLNLHPQVELALRKKMENVNFKLGNITDDSMITKLKKKQKKLKSKINMDTKSLILDFSALSYIDPSGVTMLKLLSQEFKRINIPVCIGGCSEPVYETMCKCDLLNEKANYYKIFPTVHDAVHYGSSGFTSEICVSTISRL